MFAVQQVRPTQRSVRPLSHMPDASLSQRASMRRGPPLLPMEIWTQIAGYLDLTDVRSMAMSAPVFPHMAAAPSIQVRFVARTAVLRSILPQKGDDRTCRGVAISAASGVGALSALLASRLRYLADVARAAGTDFYVPKIVAQACLAPARLGLAVADTWQQPHPIACNAMAFGTYFAISAGTMTGFAAAMGVGICCAFYLPEYVRLYPRLPPNPDAWHRGLRRLIDAPVDRIMDAWHIEEQRFAHKFEAYTGVYRASRTAVATRLLKSPSPNWSEADQARLLTYGLPFAARWRDARADDPARGEVFVALLQSCMAPENIRFGEHLTRLVDPERLADAVWVAGHAGHAPKPAHVHAWIAQNWLVPVATFVAPLQDRRIDTIAWRQAAQAFIDADVARGPHVAQGTQPLLSYAANIADAAGMRNGLHRAGAHMDASGHFGTALHCALLLGHTQNARALRGLGADCAARRLHNKTPEQSVLENAGLA